MSVQSRLNTDPLSALRPCRARPAKDPRPVSRTAASPHAQPSPTTTTVPRPPRGTADASLGSLSLPPLRPALLAGARVAIGDKRGKRRARRGTSRVRRECAPRVGHHADIPDDHLLFAATTIFTTRPPPPPPPSPSPPKPQAHTPGIQDPSKPAAPAMVHRCGR